MTPDMMKAYRILGLAACLCAIAVIAGVVVGVK